MCILSISTLNPFFAPCVLESKSKYGNSNLSKYKRGMFCRSNSRESIRSKNQRSPARADGIASRKIEVSESKRNEANAGASYTANEEPTVDEMTCTNPPGGLSLAIAQVLDIGVLFCLEFATIMLIFCTGIDLV